MGQAPVDRLRAAYKEWHDSKGRSIETWLDLMADRLKFHSLANGAAPVEWTKQRRSKEEVRGYLQGLTAAMTMIHYKVERFVCEGDTVVAIGSTAWHHLKANKRIDTPKVDIWRFNEAGQAIEFTEFYDTAQLIECSRATP